MNVAEHMLARGADSAAAVLSQNAVLTYDELRERVSQVANALLAQGHAKGDRLGIFAENGAFFVTAYLGIIRAGLVAVPLQNDLTPEALTRMALDAGMSAVLVMRPCKNVDFPEPVFPATSKCCDVPLPNRTGCKRRAPARPIGTTSSLPLSPFQ